MIPHITITPILTYPDRSFFLDGTSSEGSRLIGYFEHGEDFIISERIDGGLHTYTRKTDTTPFRALLLGTLVARDTIPVEIHSVSALGNVGTVLNSDHRLGL
jgi:hypothetical protein